MFLLSEPFVSADAAYRRERATGRQTRVVQVLPSRRRSTRSRRARSLVHRLATGH